MIKSFFDCGLQSIAIPIIDKVLPEAPDELIVELSARYILLYELITGEKFEFPDLTDIDQRIKNNIKELI